MGKLGKPERIGRLRRLGRLGRLGRLESSVALELDFGEPSRAELEIFRAELSRADTL